MKNTIFYASITIFFLTITSCGWRNDCVVNYDIQVPLELNSFDSIVHVGDTINIKMSTDNTELYDAIGDRTIHIPNFDPLLTIQFFRLDTLPLQEVFMESDIIIDEAFSYELESVANIPRVLLMRGIKSDELSSQFELSIVSNIKPGTYAIHFVPFLRFNSEIVDFEGKCDDRSKIEVTFLLPEEKIINEDILDEFSKMVQYDTLWEGKSGAYNLSSSYYFKVIE